MFEGLGYRYSTNAKGLVRAFDVKTGKQLWRFNTIPGPGEFGNDTWENGSWEWTGNVGVWTQISVDPEAGLVYLPVETPTIDEYGGNRPGNNLFAESIVAVDLKTGVRKWHFQQVHHGLWDHDNSSASLLIDATINGQPRKLLAQPTKQGWLYVFDRITGQPIWPIPEDAGAADEYADGEDVADAADPEQAASLLADVRQQERPDRLHAGAARAGAREPEAVPLGAVAVRSAARPERSAASDRSTSATRRRRELAGLGLRSGDRDLLHAGEQLRGRVVKFSNQEFNQIRADQFNAQHPRKPRWEAEPNYGKAGTRPARRCMYRRPRRLETTRRWMASARSVKAFRDFQL